ncbi:MAG: gamma-glutamyltransferase [Rhodothermales bacterium]|nr:gamma-glutamyltransferase [Rhodothermales bacterium]MBO6778748.1 gamma-glutamyltransferase [Rhodothermales bacterium]
MRVFVLFASFALAMSAEAQHHKGDRFVGANFAGRSPVAAMNGIAATSQPLASAVAIDILKAGGTAVDAAIAANAVLGLSEPTGCGIGGDLFAIVWDPSERRLHGLNASGRAPGGQTLEQLQTRLGDRDGIPLFGSLAVSVPGAVDGWFELHDRFGSLPMDQILAPAIAYAEGGFPLSPVIADGWAMNFRRFDRNADDIEELDNLRSTFAPDGSVPEYGDVFRNPDLGATYRQIAAGGRDAFYRGEIAETIDRYMKRIGGPLRAEDLAAHRSEWVDPVSVNYRGYDVWELPPNGQGIAALQMLQIIKGYDLAAMGFGSADYLHVSTEAKRLAFEDRARYYADPDFVEAPVDRLLSDEYGVMRRGLIDMSRAMPSVEAGDPVLETGDTIYLTVADRNGMMVSFIQSNYAGMGSGLVPDGLGFVFQNRGAQFSLTPGHANVYEPGKRPFHTIIPAFVTKDGEPWLSFGVMGGAMQPQGHVQILVNMIDFGMNVQEAGDAARYRHTGSSQPTGSMADDTGLLSLESGIALEVVRELEARGHRVRHAPMQDSFGGYQAIRWDPVRKVYFGATEMRKDGIVVGY